MASGVGSFGASTYRDIIDAFNRRGMALSIITGHGLVPLAAAAPAPAILHTGTNASQPYHASANAASSSNALANGRTSSPMVPVIPPTPPSDDGAGPPDGDGTPEISFIPATTTAIRRQPGAKIRPSKYNEVYTVPLSGTTEPNLDYYTRHVLSPPSHDDDERGFGPLARALDKSVRLFKAELLDYAESLRGANVLGGLSDIELEDVKRRLQPGSDLSLLPPHLALAADLNYILIPCVSRLGAGYSYTYIPTQEQPGRELSMIPLQHDGRFYAPAVLNLAEALPPIRTRYWGEDNAKNIVKTPFHRNEIHNKRRWFETWAIDGVRGKRKCMCWLGPEQVGAASRELVGRGARKEETVAESGPGRRKAVKKDGTTATKKEGATAKNKGTTAKKEGTTAKKEGTTQHKRGQQGAASSESDGSESSEEEDEAMGTGKPSASSWSNGSSTSPSKRKRSVKQRFYMYDQSRLKGVQSRASGYSKKQS